MFSNLFHSLHLTLSNRWIRYPSETSGPPQSCLAATNPRQWWLCAFSSFLLGFTSQDFLFPASWMTLRVAVPATAPACSRTVVAQCKGIEGESVNVTWNRNEGTTNLEKFQKPEESLLFFVIRPCFASWHEIFLCKTIMYLLYYYHIFIVRLRVLFEISEKFYSWIRVNYYISFSFYDCKETFADRYKCKC